MSANRKSVMSKAGRPQEIGGAKRSAEISSKKILTAKAPAGKSTNKTVGSYVLSAPKGPRTVSHKRIKEAVEKVFRERPVANG
jgi:hypothetical protein